MPELAELSTEELIKELANRQQPKPAAQQQHEQRLAELREAIDAQEIELEQARVRVMQQGGSGAAIAIWRQHQRKLQELQEEATDLKEILAPEPPQPEPMPDELKQRLAAARQKAAKAKQLGKRRGSKQDLLAATRANRELQKLELEASAYASE